MLPAMLKTYRAHAHLLCFRLALIMQSIQDQLQVYMQDKPHHIIRAVQQRTVVLAQLSATGMPAEVFNDTSLHLFL